MITLVRIIGRGKIEEGGRYSSGPHNVLVHRVRKPEYLQTILPVVRREMK